MLIVNFSQSPYVKMATTTLKYINMTESHLAHLLSKVLVFNLFHFESHSDLHGSYFSGSAPEFDALGSLKATRFVFPVQLTPQWTQGKNMEQLNLTFSEVLKQVVKLETVWTQNDLWKKYLGRDSSA